MRGEVEVAPGTAGALSLVRQSELQQCDRKGRETIAEFASTEVCCPPPQGNPVGVVPLAVLP